MTLPMFITSAQVAQLLDLPSANAFLSRRDDLEGKGFPTPCPWIQRPMKWRTEQVQNWIEAVTRPRAQGGKPQLVTPDYYMERAASA